MGELNNHIDGYQEWINHLQGDDSSTAQRMFSSESYYKTFWEYSLNGVIIIDECGTIIEANPAFCDLLGLTFNEVHGENIKRFVADGEFREDMRIIDTLVVGKAIDVVKEEYVKFKFKDGGPFVPVRLKAVRIPTTINGKFRHILVQFYDQRKAYKGGDDGDLDMSKPWSYLIKVILFKHFGKVASVLLFLLFMVALSGNLGQVVTAIIEACSDNKTVQVVPAHNQDQCPTCGGQETQTETTDGGY